MKKFLLLVFIPFLGYQSIYAQLMLGSKIEYNRFVDPGMNGATLNIFAEAPFGRSDSFSIRSGIFGRLPMHCTDRHVNELLVYDPNSLEEGLTVYTKFNDIGFFSEFSYFPFDGDPSGSDFYVTFRASFSYSTLKRWSDDPYTEQLLEAETKKKRFTKFSYGFGAGFGYQFLIGEKTLIFSELMVGLPFVSIDDSLPSSSLSDFPMFYFSGNAGFRYFLFQ